MWCFEMLNLTTNEHELWFGYSMQDAIRRMEKNGHKVDINNYKFLMQDYED